MYRYSLRCQLSFFILLLFGCVLATKAQKIPTKAQVLTVAAAEGSLIWQQVKASGEPDANLTSRDVFSYALVLCETGTHLERLPRLFDLLLMMQDRDVLSPGFGNFRWNWFDQKVVDFNAADFCMRSGTLLWINYRETLPINVKNQLHELLSYAIEGCMRHKVAPSYTNIALMNASNLILLGETLDKSEVAEEGYDRLRTVFQYTQKVGIHEFASPTYYGTDLDALVVLEAYCRQQQGREQAGALLELFWTDIAYNWHPKFNRLAGAHSRSYDYLHGTGYLDTQLWRNGWSESAPVQDIDAVYAAQASWFPSPDVKDYARQFPRLVRESWGEKLQQSRTHFLQQDITVSTSAATYGRIDVPMSVDGLDQSSAGVRCYFQADGRSDPFGKSKVAADAAHQKSIHLTPFFTAVQDKADALALVIYRDKDIPEGTSTLASHWIMPLHTDGFWIDKQPIAFQEGEAVSVALRPGASLLVRSGTAALGVKIPWTRNRQGEPAPVNLVYDGNPYGALRLTVQHQDTIGGSNQSMPGAAFWIRVGSSLETSAAFDKWSMAFMALTPTVNVSPDRIEIQIAPNKDERLLIDVAAPYEAPADLLPAPTESVLEVNGSDIGLPILKNKTGKR